MLYSSGKNYGHDVGLSCCFRQWRADSHCNQLHGYSLAFEFTFECDTLNDKNWVVDFGSMKPVKQWLEGMFDHKLAVALDDPEHDYICSLAGLGIADVISLPAVGCEAFAQRAHQWVSDWVTRETWTETGPRVRLIETRCREHGANWAGVRG